jgi:hypothetical protein
MGENINAYRFVEALHGNLPQVIGRKARWKETTRKTKT